jgi:hypothetical protein
MKTIVKPDADWAMRDRWHTGIRRNNAIGSAVDVLGDVHGGADACHVG